MQISSGAADRLSGSSVRPIAAIGQAIGDLWAEKQTPLWVNVTSIVDQLTQVVSEREDTPAPRRLIIPRKSHQS